jgi:YVTN family beta-propeller protein
MKVLKVLLLASFTLLFGADTVKPYLSPGAVVVVNDGKTAYVALGTARGVAVADLATHAVTATIATRQNPNGLVLSPDGATLYATCGEERGGVEIIALPQGKVKKVIETGHTPCGMALADGGKTLFVANRFSNTISVINTEKKTVEKEIAVVREPRFIALSPDGATLAVSNFLPTQAATDDVVASEITLIDVAAKAVKANITLPTGSQSAMGVAFSPDGSYLYAVHILSRFYVPITQIDRGWVNTNALSIVDMKTGALYATVLLDDVDNGAANPADIGIGRDSTLYIAIAGTHELMSLNLKGLHARIAGILDGTVKDANVRTREEMSSSLSFTYPFKRRMSLKGRVPTYLAFTDSAVLVSSRFSAFIEETPLGGLHEPAQIALGAEPEADAYRRGELAFNDATICYQQWHTCASCHPDGRADGINWDQQNDGLGNPKNTKSLLYSHVTPPCMITGIRESAEKAVRAGIKHTLQTVQPEQLATDMDVYLKSMPQQESPFIRRAAKKTLSQGKKLFTQAGCASCHSGEYFTDMQKYDVGTGDGADLGRPFDTPTLREVWRTAPYLYDGRAATLEDVFKRFNKNDRHGETSRLTKDELDALILYINGL